MKAEPERPATMMAVISTADLAQDGDAQKIDGVDFRAEAAELIGALIGDHHAEQEGQQAQMIGKRRQPGLFDVMDERLETAARAAADTTASLVSTVIWPRKPSSS